MESFVDFTEPFTPSLREQLLSTAVKQNISVRDGATYACTQGPRLETAAEVQRIGRDGGDLIGMTLMPEAALCREKQLAFASICMVVNPAAGVVDNAIDFEQIRLAMGAAANNVRSLIQQL